MANNTAVTLVKPRQSLLPRPNQTVLASSTPSSARRVVKKQSDRSSSKREHMSENDLSSRYDLNKIECRAVRRYIRSQFVNPHHNHHQHLELLLTRRLLSNVFLLTSNYKLEKLYLHPLTSHKWLVAQLCLTRKVGVVVS